MLYHTALSVVLLTATVSATFTCDASNAYTEEDLAAAANQEQQTTDPTLDCSTVGYIDPACPYAGQQCAGALCSQWQLSSFQVSGSTFIADLIERRSTRGEHAPRAGDSIECEDADICITALGVLACVDTQSGDFTDSTGGKGNVNSGTYTSANGNVMTETSVATIGTRTAPLPTTITNTVATTENAGTTTRPAVSSQTSNVAGNGAVAFRRTLLLGLSVVIFEF